MLNNRTNKTMTQNFGRVLISSVYAKVDSPEKDITMVRVPVRTEEEYMEQHKKLNKNHGGLCEIVGLDEFQVKPYFDLDPKGEFDLSASIKKYQVGLKYDLETYKADMNSCISSRGSHASICKNY